MDGVNFIPVRFKCFTVLFDQIFLSSYFRMNVFSVFACVSVQKHNFVGESDNE